jgi:uncharacterized LabA/DUF88 family protein
MSNKKKQEKSNYAFIDSQNLNLAIRALGWKIDWNRFRVYLKDKYNVEVAYLFIGYMGGNERLYTFLQEVGYICIFKPTLQLPDLSVKGNVDAELVLHAMIYINNYEKAVVVSGDGDFHCLVEYLVNNSKLERLLVPNKNSYSSLLKHLSATNNNIIAFVSDQREKIEYFKRKEKRLSSGQNPARTSFVVMS